MRIKKDQEPTIGELAIIVPPDVKTVKGPRGKRLHERRPNLPMVAGLGPDGRFRSRVGTPEESGSDLTPHTPQTLKKIIIENPPPIGSHAVEETVAAIDQAVAYSRRKTRETRTQALKKAREPKPIRKRREPWPKGWTTAEKDAIRPYRHSCQNRTSQTI